MGHFMGMYRVRRLPWSIWFACLMSVAVSLRADPLEHVLNIEVEVSQSAFAGLACALDQLETNYQLHTVGWTGGLDQIKAGNIDGVVRSQKGKELDRYGSLSAPFALEKWFWYEQSPRKSAVDKRHISRIGSVKGSNEAHWKETNDHAVAKEYADNLSLLKGAIRGEIDTFLFDETHLLELLQQLTPDERNVLESYHRTFARYAPMSVYLSDGFLSSHPEFLARFNEAIENCLKDSLRLSVTERQQIQSIYEYRIRRLLGHPEIIRILEWQNREHVHITPEEIETLDQQWRYELHQQSRPMINNALSLEISRFLRRIQEDSEGLFSEIMLVDRCGLNAGQSTVTSDYYQGDEPQYTEILGDNGKDLYIGEIEYDASSQGYQVKLSARVYDGHNEPVGLISFGIDAEKALQGSSLLVMQ